MAMPLKTLDVGALPAVEVRPGITRRTFSTAKLTWIRYAYEPGSVFPAHSHPEEQMTLVLEGTIQFTVGEETVLLSPGEAAVIPGGMPHAARVVGSARVVTDNVLVPARRGELKLGGG